MLDWIEDKIKKLYGFPTPYALSSKGWRDYESKYKSEHPLMFFFFETFCRNSMRYIHWWFINPYRDFMYGLRMRFVVKPSVVNIQTLKKSVYSDPSDILLHAAFQVLVDYVEWEVGCHKRKLWWRILRRIPILGYLVPTYRDAETGMAHLSWESGLVWEENMVGKDSPDVGLPTPQALAAKDKLRLYLWWKIERPSRVEAMELSGINKYYQNRPVSRFFMDEETSEKDRAEWSRISDECTRIEEAYAKEDEENLILLMKIRQSLWS